MAKNIAISDIFSGLGVPKQTYVAQEDGIYELQLTQGINESGTLCLITGSSKTGKTTLYNKVISNEKKWPLLVRCDSTINANKFWKRPLEIVDFSRLGYNITVGIDGGYLHGRDKDNRKAGTFKVIVGKSMQREEESKRFGFVHGDEKAKRRLYNTLEEQGLQMNQDITFLSDGGDTVRDLQMYLSPQAEHILDWFHITMRITVLKQMAKGVSSIECFKDLVQTLERIKWYLWHGNVFRALQLLEDIEEDIEVYQYDNEISKSNKNLKKLLKTVKEFNGYISNNRNYIPNYQDRHFYGESISSAFVESTVNEVISKRMKKKQQMRWTKEGAHLLLQVRIKTLNEELYKTFQRWYPEMKMAS